MDHTRGLIQDKLAQHLQLCNLVWRNQHSQHHRFLSSQDKISLPFFIIASQDDAHVQVANDGYVYHDSWPTNVIDMCVFIVDWAPKSLKLHLMPWMNKWCLKMPMCFDVSVLIAFQKNNWQHGYLIHHGNPFYHPDLLCMMTRSTSDPVLIWYQQHLHDSDNQRHHSNLNFQSFFCHLHVVFILSFFIHFHSTMSSFLYSHTFHHTHTQKQHFSFWFIELSSFLFFILHIFPFPYICKHSHLTFHFLIHVLSALFLPPHHPWFPPIIPPTITHTLFCFYTVCVLSKYLLVYPSKQSVFYIFLFLDLQLLVLAFFSNAMTWDPKDRESKGDMFHYCMFGVRWFVRTYWLPIWRKAWLTGDKKSTSLGSMPP